MGSQGSGSGNERFQYERRTQYELVPALNHSFKAERPL